MGVHEAVEIAILNFTKTIPATFMADRTPLPLIPLPNEFVYGTAFGDTESQSRHKRWRMRLGESRVWRGTEYQVGKALDVHAEHVD